jgi:transcriptional regulator with XRE-family HTH domain
MSRSLNAGNIKRLLRSKGYSRRSFSIVTGIDRAHVDHLLSDDESLLDASTHSAYLDLLREKFDLPGDYFTQELPIEMEKPTQRSARAQELLDGLDNILDIYALYL